MVVPEEQMRSFIIVAGSEEEQVRLLDEQSFDLSKGMRVRVTGGMFEGAEGVLTKVSGARDRRVVVRIEGVAAVAAPTIDARLIEPID
jgi:transcription antitermination factor NusG